MFLEKNKKKIVDISTMTKVLNGLRGKKKIIMCHGNFDIVHPGHIRHLSYAKSKADILIVTITSDKSVLKKKLIPTLPDNLRANNLAALNMVDYVIIDKNSHPYKNISKIKPNFFAKGYEYKNLDNIETKKELKVVEKHGGKLIFSPGDLIFSSTYLKNQYSNRKNNKNLDNIRSFLKENNLSVKKINKYFEKIKKIKVHVVGDAIIDENANCDLIGQTNKTPTFSIKKKYTDRDIGGAAVVALHLKSLGAKVELTTVSGNDVSSKFLKSVIKKNKIKINLLLDNNRPTTVKTRYWIKNYKMLQIDKVDNTLIENKKIEQIIKIIKSRKSDLIVFSDFRHGIFDKYTIKKFLKATKYKKIIKVADSQVSNRWGNICDFENMDIIFPNEKEARFSIGDQDTALRPLGQKILKNSKAKNLILKLGDRGLMTFFKTGFYPSDFKTLPTFAENVKDSVGSGDALLSLASLIYVITKNIYISAFFGSLSSAINCEKNGNKPVFADEIKKLLKNANEE